jgi:hypothetical protein
MHIHVVVVKVGESYCVAEKLGDMMSSEKRESRFGSWGGTSVCLSVYMCLFVCLFVCVWVR